MRRGRDEAVTKNEFLAYCTLRCHVVPMCADGGRVDVLQTGQSQWGLQSTTAYLTRMPATALQTCILWGTADMQMVYVGRAMGRRAMAHVSRKPTAHMTTGAARNELDLQLSYSLGC
jgi:hypothetical protein